MQHIPLWCLMLVVFITGCSKGWTITAENRSKAACSIEVELGGAHNDRSNFSGSSSIDDLKPGSSVDLIGGKTPTRVLTIKAKQNDEEQAIEWKQDLQPGQRLKLVISDTGKLQASVE